MISSSQNRTEFARISLGQPGLKHLGYVIFEDQLDMLLASTSTETTRCAQAAILIEISEAYVHTHDFSTLPPGLAEHTELTSMNADFNARKFILIRR